MSHLVGSIESREIGQFSLVRYYSFLRGNVSASVDTCLFSAPKSYISYVIPSGILILYFVMNHMEYPFVVGASGYFNTMNFDGKNICVDFVLWVDDSINGETKEGQDAIFKKYDLNKCDWEECRLGNCDCSEFIRKKIRNDEFTQCQIDSCVQKNEGAIFY